MSVKSRSLFKSQALTMDTSPGKRTIKDKLGVKDRDSTVLSEIEKKSQWLNKHVIDMELSLYGPTEESARQDTEPNNRYK